MGGRVGTGRRGRALTVARGSTRSRFSGRGSAAQRGTGRRPPSSTPALRATGSGAPRRAIYYKYFTSKNLNPAECHTARMATTTTSLARGTSHAALATRTRPRAVRRHRVAVRANASRRMPHTPGDSDDVDDEDLAYDATEMTYADLPSVPGGSTLDVSRAFTVDIDPSIVANAMPNRGVLEYVRLPANEYNVWTRPRCRGSTTGRSGSTRGFRRY